VKRVVEIGGGKREGLGESEKLEGSEKRGTESRRGGEKRGIEVWVRGAGFGGGRAVCGDR
jgi:hypothetical protein